MQDQQLQLLMLLLFCTAFLMGVNKKNPVSRTYIIGIVKPPYSLKLPQISRWDREVIDALTGEIGTLSMRVHKSRPMDDAVSQINSVYKSQQTPFLEYKS